MAADAESAEARKSCFLPKVRQLQMPKAHKVAMLQEMHAARHAMSGSHAMTILDSLWFAYKALSQEPFHCLFITIGTVLLSSLKFEKS